MARVSAANTTKIPASTARMGRNLNDKNFVTLSLFYAGINNFSESLINFQETILITGD
jgi:hypothetical protein